MKIYHLTRAEFTHLLQVLFGYLLNICGIRKTWNIFVFVYNISTKSYSGNLRIYVEHQKS